MSPLGRVAKINDAGICTTSLMHWRNAFYLSNPESKSEILRSKKRDTQKVIVVLCCVCDVLGRFPPCSRVRPLAVLCHVCSVLSHLAPVHRCAPSVCCVVCAVSWATWLLFAGVLARCVVLGVRCPEPLGFCSPVCPLRVLCFVCNVLGHLAPVHRCARLVRCVVCVVSWATWLLFTSVLAWCVVLCVRCAGPPGSCSCVCLLSVSCCVCGVLGHLAPVHPCAPSVCCVLCAVSWATWLLFSGLPAQCVVLHVRCPGPLGSFSPVCSLGALCCVCSILGHLAPVHRCACSVCCVACAVSWATWLLFIGVPARCVVSRVRCPGLLGSCSPVCLLLVLCCVCGVLGHLAPVHRCVRSVRCVVCAVSWATWLLFMCVPAQCVVLLLLRPGPLGSCSPVCPLGVLCLVCGVLGHLALVCGFARSVLCVACCGVLGHLALFHRCARSVRSVACALSWAIWLLFTGVPARCVVSRVRCPGPLGPGSLVSPLDVLCRVCSVLGYLAPVHRCAPSMCCVACAVSRVTWLLFTGVLARCVVLCVWCPGLPGSCSSVCLLSVLCCVCDVLGHLAPVHRCAPSVCCVLCAMSWATWLLFAGLLAQCVALHVRCPRPLASFSPVCSLGALCCVCSDLGHLTPVHPCACSVCCVACAVSWATWLLFTGVAASCVVLPVRCPGLFGSCSPVCSLRALRRVCGVLGHLAPVRRYAGLVRCVACVVSWATWFLFTGVLAWCVASCVRCPGPLGSCSPVCPLRVLCCVCDVLGFLVPVHRCARLVRCVVCAVSWATWLLFAAVLVWCGVLRVWPLGFCSPVCSLGVLRGVCGVLGHMAPVHRCDCSVCCVGCVVTWATWHLFTGVPTRYVVLRVWCPRPL